ncbi:hypothetical protein AHAS_Ahas18G0269200 [Arachis hypogaea]
MHLANNHHIPFLSSPKLTQSSIQSSSLHILHSNPNSSKPPTTTRSDTPCIHKSYVGDVSSAISAFSVMNTTAALSSQKSQIPPIGIRGSAHSVVRVSGYDIDEGYLGSYQEEMVIICQVESVEGVKNVGEISAVDGIDCIQMGLLDLSASMGYL